MSFTYNNIEYKTLSEASTKLGILYPYLFNLKKQRDFTDAEAVAYAIEKRRGDTVHQGQNKECVVDGAVYISIAAACRHYEIPYVSVRSRMMRNKETAEEAILVLTNTKKLGAQEAAFSKYRLELCSLSLDELSPIQIKGLAKKLVLRGYSLSLFSMEDSDKPVIKIKFTRFTIWLVFYKDKTAIIVSDFCSMITVKNQKDVLNKIDIWNSQHSDIILFIDEVGTEVLARHNVSNNSKHDLPVMHVIKAIEYIEQTFVRNIVV